jgi:hypothetical protein
MHRPSAQQFLLTLLEGLEDIPPDLARRLAEVVEPSTPLRPRAEDADRSQTIRQLFEELAGE